jgi:hypothetical protein
MDASPLPVQKSALPLDNHLLALWKYGQLYVELKRPRAAIV